MRESERQIARATERERETHTEKARERERVRETDLFPIYFSTRFPLARCRFGAPEFIDILQNL